MTIEARIRLDIETRIHAGDWRPGDRIPFEHELVRLYSCSRATVSKALGSLSRAGLIERRRKAGSFVAHPHVHSAVLQVPDLAQLITARGASYSWRRTARRSGDDGGDVVSSPALLIEGVHCENGTAFAAERRLIAIDVVPEARHESFADEAPGSWLLRHVPWTTARHRIRAVAASRAEALSLAVRPGTACLELTRVTWRAAMPVTEVRQLFLGDRFDLVAEFRPGE